MSYEKDQETNELQRVLDGNLDPKDKVLAIDTIFVDSELFYKNVEKMAANPRLMQLLGSYFAYKIDFAEDDEKKYQYSLYFEKLINFVDKIGEIESKFADENAEELKDLTKERQKLVEEFNREEESLASSQEAMKYIAEVTYLDAQIAFLENIVRRSKAIMGSLQFLTEEREGTGKSFVEVAKVTVCEGLSAAIKQALKDKYFCNKKVLMDSGPILDDTIPYRDSRF